MTTPAKRILAFDTSSTRGLVVAFEQAVGHPPNIIAEWALSLDTGKHSERLLWSIDTVLIAAGWDLSQLNAIAVGVGPGSFTGLRIGVTTARMLASQLNIPLYAIDSLRIQSWSGFLSTSEPNVKVFSCSDAAKGEWFYNISSSHNLGDSKVSDPETALSDLAQVSNQSPWLAIGLPVMQHLHLFLKLKQTGRLVSPHDLPLVSSARGLAMETARVYLNEATPDFNSVLPKYLRASDAEVKLKAGLLPKAATDI